MPDEIPTTETIVAAAATSEPVTPPAGTAQPQVAFTPEQQEALNRIVQQRLTEDRARRPVAPVPVAPVQAAKPTPPAPVKPSDGSMSASDVQALLARDRAFTRATATAGLTDRQVERMEAALRAANPDDVSTWSRDYLEDMKLGQPVTATTTTSPAIPTHAPTTPAEAPKPPPAAPSAPSGHALPTQNGVVDVFSLTPQQLKELGPAGVRGALEKLQAFGHQQAGMPQRPKPPSQR